ncbi:hypothetical protein L1987_30435 [Smallanthus sonchifolius]|uniref:Uncharacterized protein n=1 Tax=Smallanthus sonchifolius TaxID=185202 RepID=A0ACB9I2U1_9ASTR|nr:hypothetical protein L1987_30435 [Smallanthus sonchifolius]
MSFIKEDLECFHPDDLEEMDIQHAYAMLSIRAKRFYSRIGRPIPNTTEIPPQVYEHLYSQACIDKVLGKRKHNQNLIDQNEEFHQMKSEFTKLENSYKEKINCLKKEISLLKHEQTNLETQIDDLLARLKATRAELAEQKVHVDKYEFASKKLQRLLDAQIHDKANRDLDPSRHEPVVQECTTSSESESESTCSKSTKTEEASSPVQVPAPPVLEVIQTSAHVPLPAVPVPTLFKQIKISYPPEGRKLTVEKGQSSTSSNSKPQRKVFDICHAPGERVPYVQKTLEDATFEHNKAHPWNFKDSFKRKDYVYFQRDKLAKSCFVCGKYNHTASTCFYYLQQQRNLKQHAFEKTHKNRKILHQAPPKQKPISMITSTEKPSVNKAKKDKHTLVVEPSAASKTVGNQARPKKLKDKPSAATKSATAQVKPSAATKSTADKRKSSATKSTAADKTKSSAATTSAADKPKS